MKFKKLVSLGLITVMAASLAACGDNKTSNTVGQGVGNPTSSSAEKESGTKTSEVDNNGPGNGVDNGVGDDSGITGSGEAGGYATNSKSITVAKFDEGIDVVGKVKYLFNDKSDDSIIYFDYDGKLAVDAVSNMAVIFSEPYVPTRYIDKTNFSNMENKKEEIVFQTRNEVIYKSKDGSYTMVDIRPTKEGNTYNLELNGGRIVEVRWHAEYKTNVEIIVVIVLKDNKLTYELFGTDGKHIKSLPAVLKNYDNSSRGEEVNINISDMLIDSIKYSEGFKILDANGELYENGSIGWTGFFELDNFKDEALPESVDKVEYSVKLDKLYYHGGIKNIVYSKADDNSNVYIIELSNLDRGAKELPIALPQGYTVDNIDKLYVNDEDVLFVFTDKNVYVSEEALFTDGYNAPVLLEDVTALNKTGAIRQFGVTDNADCSGFIFLADDNTLYSIDW